MLVLFLVGACSDSGKADAVKLDVPHGFQQVLRLERDGQVAGFGPFVGYYFRPENPDDLSRLRFVCFNERGFYSSDMPVNALLFRGRARLATLPGELSARPQPIGRITPVYFTDAPGAWLATRPEPRDGFVHFHSLHDGRGARMDGYWLIHEATASFTYDMGGRVTPESPLFHETSPGVDTAFAHIVEFDQGPAWEQGASHP
jgi:hypothetical protein